MKILIELYLVFVKIGLMMFGGGYAALPILEREIADKRQWATKEELLGYYAVGQCTPGVIAVNVSTFIGYKKCGTIGGIITTLGVITPPLLIITALASILDVFTHNDILIHAFAGVRLAIAALILNAIFNFRKAGIKNIYGEVIFWLTLAVTLVFNISPVVVVVIVILIGVLKELRTKNKS